MPAKVLLIALDAAERSLVERWASEGSLPNLARLAETGTTFRLTNSIETLPDAIWTEISTGRTGAAVGWSFWRQIHAGETQLRVIRPEELDLTAFWHHASRAGRRVAVLDVPKTGSSQELNGVHLREWGAHDKPFGAASDPPEFLDSVLQRYGEYPLSHDHAARTRCDDHDETAASYERMLARLLEGVDRKAELVRDVLEQDEWDLLFAVFSESHCVGHQFWHFLDESSPWHDPDAPDALKRAIHDVYARLDRALAHVLGGAGPETTVLILLSHGMSPMQGGWQLLPEVLVRLGYGSGQGVASSVRGRLPEPLKRTIRAVVRGRARSRLQEAAGSLPDPLGSPRTRATAVWNVPHGAIRLNVRGREPFGCIEPGAEYDAACEELIRELEALENPDTGRPAVAAAVRADAVYGDRLHPNIPDILVRFSAETPVHAVRSTRIGTVSGPIRTPALPRSGEHTTRSALLAAGPGVPGRRISEGGHVLDVAPTVLELLGVPAPATLDGRPLDLSPALAST